MQSKNIGYIEKLDHLRFLAAFTVIEFHSELWFAKSGWPAEIVKVPLFHQGYTGVGLFMVISGLILTAITFEREIDTLKFYLNRILRIYPLFILVVALGYFSTPDPRPTSTGIDFLLALLPISNLYRLHYGAYGGVLFSVAIELQFYLLFPALLLFLRRYGIAFYAGLLVLLLVLRALVFAQNGHVHHMAYYTIFGGLDLFLIGALAGIAYMRMQDRPAYGWAVLPLLLLINAVLHVAHARWPFFFHFDYAGLTTDGLSRSKVWIVWPTVQGVLWAAFVLAYLRSRLRIPLSGVFAYLGKISYSLYLWHTIVCMLAVRYGWKYLPPYGMGLFVILPITAVLSVLSYHLVEEPFLALRQRYIRARLGEAPAPAARSVAA